MRFNPKISALEERLDLDSISMDELHGIFTAYEMRTEQENPDVKEAAFKASKRSKKNKKEQEEYSSSSDASEDDEEVANFVKKLNKGTNGRYVLIRKREMMKVTQKENTHIKAKELQIIFLRKTYTPKKTSHHQMRMKSVTMR
jgi:hypothetical protein